MAVAVETAVVAAFFQSPRDHQTETRPQVQPAKVKGPACPAKEASHRTTESDLTKLVRPEHVAERLEWQCGRWEKRLWRR